MDLPQTKLKRAFTGGKTALEIGGNTLKYIVKKPFISSSKKEEAKHMLHLENAEILFKGLSQLKGTALKIAQLLCLELELLHDEYRKELQKAEDPESLKKQLIDEFAEKFENPYVAASLGTVDNVIDPAETRPMLIKALEMLANKREKQLPRKHGNINL